MNLEHLEQSVRKEGVDCACDGKDDCVYVYITQEDKLAWVKEFLHALTGLHPSAFHPVCIDSIPRNSSGKILYAALPKVIQNG